MDQKKLTLEVVTPERQVLHEQVDYVQLPGVNGYLGILPGHAPLLTELGAGILSFARGGETRYATAMGLLLEGASQLQQGRVAKQGGSVRAVFGRMRDWFQRNF